MQSFVLSGVVAALYAAFRFTGCGVITAFVGAASTLMVVVAAALLTLAIPLGTVLPVAFVTPSPVALGAFFIAAAFPALPGAFVSSASAAGRFPLPGSSRGFFLPGFPLVFRFFPAYHYGTFLLLPAEYILEKFLRRRTGTLRRNRYRHYCQYTPIEQGIKKYLLHVVGF